MLYFLFFCTFFFSVLSFFAFFFLLSSADIGGADITGYKLQVKKDDANGWVVPTGWVDGLKFAFTDTGLDPEKLFQYRIIAINSVGSSVPGSPLTLVSKSKCPLYFSPAGDCSSFALCELGSSSLTGTAFCADLTTTIFVSSRFGNDDIQAAGRAGHSGNGLSTGEAGFPGSASPVKSLSQASLLVTASRYNIVLYPADDFPMNPFTCTVKLGGVNNDCTTATADDATCAAATTSGGGGDPANACVFVDNTAADCGTVFNANAHILGFNETVESDGTITSGTKIACPMSSSSQTYTRAIVVTAGTLTISDVEFVGAGISISGESTILILHAVKFKQMSSIVSKGGDGFGSAIHSDTKARTKMYGGSVRDSMGVRGGAVSVHGGSTFELCGVTMQGNDATIAGGAVSVSSSSFAVLLNDDLGNPCGVTSLVGNTAMHGGGIHVVSGTSSSLIGSSVFNVSSNVASHGGGGVAVTSQESGDTFIMNGSGMSIHGNNAYSTSQDSQTGTTYSNGGGVSIDGPGAVDIRKTTIESNTGKNGGGVSVKNGAVVSFDSTSILQFNAAHGSGGGLHNENSTVFVLGTKIEANHAVGGNGGGVSVESGRIHIANAQLVKNKAKNNGGAIYSGPSNVNAEEEEVTVSSQVHVSDTTFDGSAVGDAGKGGHVALVSTNASFATCIFEATVSEDGAAIHATTTNLFIFGQTKIRNTEARRNGGAIYATKHSMVHLEDIEITATSSGVDGGGLYVDEKSKVNVTKSIISR